MYGLLLDSIQKFLLEKYGERYWASIRRRAKLKNHWFVTHEVYSDSLMHDLVDAAAVGEQNSCVNPISSGCSSRLATLVNIFTLCVTQN